MKMRSGVDCRGAAGALLCGNRLARHLQPLLVAVGLAVVQVAGDRLAQVRRRLEAVAAGVADVELDDVDGRPPPARARGGSVRRGFHSARPPGAHWV